MPDDGGGLFDATGNYFTGNIDEVAIFDKAIPAARVAAHYQAGKSGGIIVTTGPVTVPTTGGSAIQVTVARSGHPLTVSWSPAGGTLQTTPSHSSTPVWTDVGTSNPATINVGTSNAFYRVKTP